MSTSSEKPSEQEAITFGTAMTAPENERQEKLAAAVEQLRQEMEALAAKIRGLIIAQPQVGLLGYLWAQFFMGAIAHRKEDENARPDQQLVGDFQFVLEYVHAIWSGHAGAFGTGAVDEPKAQELLEKCKELKAKAMMYCMASTAGSTNKEFGDASTNVEFHAKSSWVLIRGHRYQVLEEEFFAFVLKPHDDALRQAYGVDSAAVAAGIQAVADTIRMGFANAGDTAEKWMTECYALVERESLSLDEAIQRIQEQNPDFRAEMEGATSDLFFGGICNLSRHTKLPAALLEDLAFTAGGNTEFFEAGGFAGTPFRTLPARVRPLIKVDDQYYATDGQFVRDAAYRAIQRGLLARLPAYREDWKTRQTELTEGALHTVLAAQFQGARIFQGVFFRDVTTNEWVESDLMAALDDVLVTAEAKAGVTAMHSPATNFERHVRVIRELVLNAYRQCKRFLEYIASAPKVPIYRLENGRYIEVARLRRRDYRLILPIGLTVESFTPFSSMCKELPEIEPILGEHPFISMSVDDLFVLNRFLPTAGELFHYLTVRQQVAGIRKAMVFDEMDHLGAYIAQNRFDQNMREQLEEADFVAWDSFSEKVDAHFEQDDWQNAPVPTQDYPEEVSDILRTLNSSRPPGWLEYDGCLRDLGGDGRNNAARTLRELIKSLGQHERRRLILATKTPIQFWVCRAARKPSVADIQHYGEVGCLAMKHPSMLVLILQYDDKGQIQHADCATVRSPPIIRVDYAELTAEAARQQERLIKFDEAPARKKGKGSKSKKS